MATDHKTDAKSNLDMACAKVKNMKTLFGKTYAITETTSHECLDSLCLNIPHPFDVVCRKRAPEDQAERELQKLVVFFCFFFQGHKRRDDTFAHFAEWSVCCVSFSSMPAITADLIGFLEFKEHVILSGWSFRFMAEEATVTQFCLLGAVSSCV